MDISTGLLLTILLVIWFAMWALKCFVTVGRTYTIIMGLIAMGIAILYALSIIHIG